LKLTAAQAAIRYLAGQAVETSQGLRPYFAGCWAIFGHGNVAGLGDALHQAGDSLPTYRAHNEQAMAHAAIAFAKQARRRRAMICTTSIGPGATNMVTAAALAHVNRLPVLFLPGDVFASRRPDPVLQQVEDFADGVVSANDCFRPVSRYFDRITRPEQLLDALPRAMATLIDPASCGPVTLAFCQDVQAEAYDWPSAFFASRVWRPRASLADAAEIDRLINLLKGAQRPLIVAGGGVLYSEAQAALAAFALAHGVPVAETQAGKGALAWDHPMNVGAIGVTGAASANALAAEADVIVGVGTRLQDFTTASRTLLARPAGSGTAQTLVQVNVAAYDATKHDAIPVVGDAGRTLAALATALTGWTAPAAWRDAAAARAEAWNAAWEVATGPTSASYPSDAQVLGAVWRQAGASAVVVCAAGGLPGELHKLWRTRQPGGYHVEYGYSCMGYEIAGGLGVKMAAPEREVFVLVGDGGYLMMNSEIATSVMLGLKLIIVVLDNGGFGCIHRLQVSTGAAAFKNLTVGEGAPAIDFAAHAASLGAASEKVASLAELDAALARAKVSAKTYVVAIDTDPLAVTGAGGAWWEVAAPDRAILDAMPPIHMSGDA
jgi:3D-(3,5/4)-trihydroxycyclohexane-1,2-dione acylhydrolase (decyclizing)